MVKREEKDPYKVEVGQRLIATRIALGYPVRRNFAKITGADERNLEKWENGGALLPPQFAGYLRQRFHIPYEWLYDGDPSRLPYELGQLLAPKTA